MIGGVSTSQLGLLASHFLADQFSVVVLLNFVTSIYALAAFATKVCSPHPLPDGPSFGNLVRRIS